MADVGVPLPGLPPPGKRGFVPGPRKSNPLGTTGPMSNPDPIANGTVRGRNFHRTTASLPPPLKIASGGVATDVAAIINPF